MTFVKFGLVLDWQGGFEVSSNVGDWRLTRAAGLQDVSRLGVGRFGSPVWLQFVQWLIRALIADFSVVLNCLMSCRRYCTGHTVSR